mmetsp:Transcript_27071/g.34837  ORF Transcript_27071/g.34837 Transcript_27071/m.34837 type:complete len:220 (-) Transcript_27071:23-682(-)
MRALTPGFRLYWSARNGHLARAFGPCRPQSQGKQGPQARASSTLSLSGLQHFPTFGFRLWCTFDDANSVAHFECVVLIVRPVFFGLTDGFLQNRVRKATLYGYGYCLCVGIACHGACQDTFGHTLRLLLFSRCRGSGFLVQNGFDTCDVTLNGLQTCGVLQLACGLLKTQVEGFFFQVNKLIAELIRRLVVQFFGVHRLFLSTSPVGPLWVTMILVEFM